MFMAVKSIIRDRGTACKLFKDTSAYGKNDSSQSALMLPTTHELPELSIVYFLKLLYKDVPKLR